MKINLNPYISVDCVIFGFDSSDLKVLLIEREKNNYNLKMKLPGDLIGDNENLDEAAYRVLKELTGLDNVYLMQFYAFGSLDRTNNEQDLKWLIDTSKLSIKRVVTVAYFSLIKINENNIISSNADYNYKWYKINEIPKLAFDHNNIITKALETLQIKLKTEPIGFELLPKKFTINQLQKLYEAILGKKLDNRNFRKKILKVPYIKKLKERQMGVAHKPAYYYKFDSLLYQKIKKTDFGFTI
jgi:hypothetical protein